MSGIVGVLHLDGAPADEVVLARMTAAGRHRGPDGTGSMVNGTLGMGYCHFDSGNRHACAGQPLTLGAFQVVLDGRIDNRKELQELSAGGRRIEECTDAELVILAFQQWGLECANRLIGEFAFGLWDAKEQRLFCARDALGVKPLHYYRDSEVFIFASQIAQLLEHPGVSPQPNEGMIAEYVCHSVGSRNETLYRNIFRLPPGHFLSVRASKIEVRQYWSFHCDAEAKEKTDEEYAQEFLSVFSEAVRCRIDDRCPAGFDLSGGLDSSSIVCVANRLTRWGSHLQGFSLTYDDPIADERAYVNEVVRFSGVTANLVKPTDVDVYRIQQIIKTDRDFPGLPNLLMFDPVFQSLRDKNIRIRLTGLGGDHWLQGDFRHTADLLRGLKVWSAIRQCRSDSRILSDFAVNASPLSLFARYGLVPLLPRSIRRTLRPVVQEGRMPFWIEPQFAQKTSLADRLNLNRNAVAAPSQFPTLVQNHLWLVANSGWFGLLLEMVDRHSFSFGVETRNPFLDRRLVEFCLSLPEEQRWRGEQMKFVLRTAMKGILPEAIRTRRSKGNFTGTFSAHLLTSEVRQTLESSTLASLGWIDQASVLRMYSQFKSDYNQGLDNPRFVAPLSMIYGVEAWLKLTF